MNEADLTLKKNYRLRATFVVLVGRIVFLELFFGFLSFGTGLFLNPENSLYSIVFWSLRILNILVLIFILLNWYFCYYIVSADALSVTHGVFYRRTNTYDLPSIRSVKVQQTLSGRLFNYGTIIMESPLVERNIRLSRISDPYHHAKIIDRQRLKLLESKSLGNITPVV